MKNKYKVPVKQWRKWGKAARAVFNETYYTMVHNQSVFLHPDDTRRPKKLWCTTAYNAAWIAASAVPSVD